MGIAVLDEAELVYQGVKSLRSAGSPHERLEEGRRIVLRLLRDFRPDLLACEHAFFAQSRNTALLNVFVDEIRALARQRGITVRSLAPSTVKKGIAGDGAAKKLQVAEAVVARYPELKVYLGQNRKWKERFHGNMFDGRSGWWRGSR